MENSICLQNLNQGVSRVFFAWNGVKFYNPLKMRGMLSIVNMNCMANDSSTT